MTKLTLYLLLLSLSSTGYTYPKNFVALKDVAPDIIQDMRYASTNNFIGNSIPGYKRGVCIVTKQTAEQLRKVQRAAKARGYSLKIYDCYRPQKAVDYFYKWSQNPKDQRQKAAFYPRENKKELFAKKYIALSSGHTRGSTVDLTLVKLDGSIKKSKQQLMRCYDLSPNYLDDDSLDMGTRFDCLDKSANLNYPKLSKAQKSNRKLLKSLMVQYGFKPYFYEWWHFTLRNEPYPDHYFNFPVR